TRPRRHPAATALAVRPSCPAPPTRGSETRQPYPPLGRAPKGGNRPSRRRGREGFTDPREDGASDSVAGGAAVDVDACGRSLHPPLADPARPPGFLALPRSCTSGSRPGAPRPKPDPQGSPSGDFPAGPG